jgi:hypothetical protein
LTNEERFQRIRERLDDFIEAEYFVKMKKKGTSSMNSVPMENPLRV